jgi:hypothetical protein
MEAAMARAQFQWTVEPLPLPQARLQSILEPVYEEADLEKGELVHEWPVHEWPGRAQLEIRERPVPRLQPHLLAGSSPCRSSATAYHPLTTWGL